MDATEAQTVTSRSKLRWYQCSLRTMLVLVLLASIGLCWPTLRMQRAREQKKHVQAIRKIEGCQVAYDSGERLYSGNLHPVAAAAGSELDGGLVRQGLRAPRGDGGCAGQPS